MIHVNDLINEAKAQDEVFFKEAFTNPVTNKPYDVPDKLKKTARRICKAYGIRGICDPMYIANIIALELGLGDGKSYFKEA